MVAAARLGQTDEQALETRRELDAQLRPYRGKMTAPQLAMLEQQYLERRVLEANQLPRLELVLSPLGRSHIQAKSFDRLEPGRHPDA